MKKLNGSSNGDETSRRWLWRLAIALTGVWLLGGFTYIFFIGGLEALASSGTEGVGGFLEGFFAPLAFLWLVIGLFIQQRELASNTEALQRTNRISEKQTEVLEATELRARQNAFFQIANNVRKQTGNLAGMLVAELVDENGNPLIDEEEMRNYWIEHQQSQPEIFPGLLITDERIDAAGLTEFEVYYGTEKARGYTAEFIKSFRHLLTLARECDTDGTILRTVTQTPHGVIYSEMLNNLVPPTCWAIVDGSAFMALSSEAPQIIGTWRVTAMGLWGEQKWRLEIHDEDGTLNGRVIEGDSEFEVEHFAASGAALFGRVYVMDSLFLFSAVISGDQLSGTLDFREGVFAQLEGSRQSIGSD